MNPNENPSPASPAAPQGLKLPRLIKLGVDVHLRECVVARQVDGLAPQSVRHFTPELSSRRRPSRCSRPTSCIVATKPVPFGFGRRRRQFEEVRSLDATTQASFRAPRRRADGQAGGQAHFGLWLDRIRLSFACMKAISARWMRTFFRWRTATRVVSYS